MLQIIIRFESHVIKAGTENGQGNQPDHKIIKMVAADAKFRRTSGAEENSKDEAKRNQNSVQVDIASEDREICRRIDAPVTE